MNKSSFQDRYKSKLIEVEEALSYVKSQFDIVMAMCANEPVHFLSSLHTIKDRVKNVNVFVCLLSNTYDFYATKDMQQSFIHSCWFHGAAARQALKSGAGTVTYVPCMLHRLASDRLDVRTPDVFVGTCTPPNAMGLVSLSLSLGYEKEMIEHAKVVILEVNKNLPFTYGDTLVHVDDVDFFMETEYQVPEIPVLIANDTELKIGEFVADLVEDEATLQLGIGSIPSAVTQKLGNKKNLGIHTEMFVDSMMELYEAGVITNKKKGFCKDKFISTFCMGSRKLYDWLDNNPLVDFQRARWTNHPDIIKKNTKMTSINTCLSVDFQGQVSSESIGYTQYSGTGGQTDTAVGSVEGLDGKGKSIIACKSTAKGDSISTIVPTLSSGSTVSLHRSHVDYIITEYGVAHLRGKSIRERTKELISISHPKFREELIIQAKKMDYII